jgi:hypothetical protein
MMLNFGLFASPGDPIALKHACRSHGTGAVGVLCQAYGKPSDQGFGEARESVETCLTVILPLPDPALFSEKGIGI